MQSQYYSRCRKSTSINNTQWPAYAKQPDSILKLPTYSSLALICFHSVHRLSSSFTLIMQLHESLLQRRLR